VVAKIFATIMDVQEKCPEETQAMFNKAEKDGTRVIIRLNNVVYEIIEVLCIGPQKK